jgi:hypothetical protein
VQLLMKHPALIIRRNKYVVLLSKKTSLQRGQMKNISMGN